MSGTGILKHHGINTSGWLAAVLLASAIAPAWAQDGIFPGDRPPAPGSLKTVPAPLPPNLSEFVVNQKAAIVLGKALFWDQQAGSDGLACASCHFQAGADNRVRNQISPGLRNELGGTVSQTFNQAGSFAGTSLAPPYGGGGPNYILKLAD